MAFMEDTGLLFYITRIVVADDLATQGAMPSTSMVLTKISHNISVSAAESYINVISLGK